MTSMSRTGSTLPDDVMDVRILEAAHHLDDGVDLADVGEELVAEPLALARALHQAGDVHELDGGRDDDVGLGDALQHVRAAASGTVTMPTFGSMVQKG